MEEQHKKIMECVEELSKGSPRGQRASRLEFFATCILQGLIFLLPLFVLPFGIFAIDFNKAMLLYFGISVAFLAFLFLRLKKGSIALPRSLLLLNLFSFAGVWLLSALFSSSTAFSLWGAGYETGTFLFFFALAVVALLVSILFHTEERILLAHILLFVSALILFTVQVIHSGFGVAIPFFAMLDDPLANLVGNWNDLGIFFGLTVILSLSFLEFANVVNIAKKARIFLRVVFAASFVAIFFVNFSTLWFVLGGAALALGAYRITASLRAKGHTQPEWRDFVRPSIFVFVVVLFIVLSQGPVKNTVTFLGLQSTQVFPSWGATVDVVRGSLDTHLLVGSGPNTFAYDWLVFKPSGIANTAFRDTRFQSGVGRALSMVAETGLLGAIALAFLFLSLLYSAKMAVSYKEHGIKKVLLTASFLGSVYLWTFVFVYSPGFLVFALAGIFTGLFLATGILVGKLTTIELSLPPKNTKKGRLARFFVFLIVFFSFYGVYALATKYTAGYFYVTALQEVATRNDMDKAEKYLERAILLDPQQDAYFRSMAELGILRLQQVVAQMSTASTVSDTDKAHIQSVLEKTVQSAKNAVSANSLDPLNWMELGRVYEAILPFDLEGLKESAILSYKEALRRSPYDLAPRAALARTELQIGVLYYQNGDYEKAQSIFEKLVNADPSYADARYALGLLYDKKGMFAQSAAQFEELNKLLPENEEIQKILGNLRAGYGALGNSLAPLAPPEEPIKKPAGSKTKAR